MEEQLFQIMKFNLYKAAHEPFGLKWISDTYLLAWQLRVYPRCHLHLTWHKPFENCFHVDNVTMSKIESHLKESWRSKDADALRFTTFLATINAASEGEVSEHQLHSALHYLALCVTEFKQETWIMVARDSNYDAASFMERPLRLRDFNLDAVPGYSHDWHKGEPVPWFIEGNTYEP